jgi:hypothetical protein
MQDRVDQRQRAGISTLRDPVALCREVVEVKRARCGALLVVACNNNGVCVRGWKEGGAAEQMTTGSHKPKPLITLHKCFQDYWLCQRGHGRGL